MWKCLLSLRDKAKEHIEYIVGNGKNISAWYDKWNEIGPLCQIIDIRDLYNARFDKNVTVPTLSDTHDKAMWRCNNGDLTKFTIRQTWNDYRGNYPEVKWKNLVCAVIYFLWQERNKRHFTMETRSAKVLSDIVMDTVKTRLRSLKVRESTNVQKVAKEWDIQFKIQNVINGNQISWKVLNA
ncbi:hypothetical protein Tco_0595661 [Tanacetum coccineum]